VPVFTGSVTGIVATIAGRPVAPAIISGPASVTTNAEAPVAFEVTVVGSAPLAYQWQFDGLDVAGATGASLTISDAQATNAGSYTVVVTNLVGRVTSPVATLTVVLPPRFRSVTLLPDGSPLLSLQAVSNLTYRIDAGTDLMNWTVLTTLPNPTGTLQFADPDATNFALRFYRAVWVP